MNEYYIRNMFYDLSEAFFLKEGRIVLTINKRQIGKKQPAYIIAEMSANHAGDIENAKKIIHAAKEAGADCINL